jgi:hypothetical protein
MNRVVVTGLGPVSSIGIGVSEFARSLFSGRSGISRISSFDPSLYPCVNGGEVRGFRPESLLERIEPKKWGLARQFAAAAGESQVLRELVRHTVDHGFAAAGEAADLLNRLPTERLAHAVSSELGAAGESLTLGTACSASNYALGYAYDLLADGEADVMLAGGADVVSRYIHAEVLGYGINCDAHHPVAPLSSAIAECIRIAHRNAGSPPRPSTTSAPTAPALPPTTSPRPPPCARSSENTSRRRVPSSRCSATRWARPAASGPWHQSSHSPGDCRLPRSTISALTRSRRAWIRSFEVSSGPAGAFGLLAILYASVG